MSEISQLLDGRFPSTRYTGSKRRLLPHLYQVFKRLDFNSAADIFCGTSSVAYLLKKMGKQVIVNDYLHSNYLTGVALIENNKVRLSEHDLYFLLQENEETSNRSDFISTMFKDFFFTDEENRWLDNCRANIEQFSSYYETNISKYKKALAYHALFQSALRKRPFNLFHRKNLYLRLANVDRAFGNQTTWNRSFSDHFIELAHEINSLVIDNQTQNLAYCENNDKWYAPYCDLVYLDPPYVWEGASESAVDYLNKYHFLEGIARYDYWPDLIDHTSPILCVKDGYTKWPHGSELSIQPLNDIFDRLLERYNSRTIVISYREQGIPTIKDLARILKKYKNYVYVSVIPYKYALRRKGVETQVLNEVIIVGINNPVIGLGDEI